MNYYEARQRNTDGRWDYTRRSAGVVAPVGYCRGEPEGADEEVAHRDRYHEDGHETKEEACECYKRYLLDNKVSLDFAVTEDVQHRCEAPGCDAWTQRVAMVHHRTYLLCDDHRNLETLRDLVVVSSSMGAY
jgi:hypothetical protein